jgi:hypothetical protein
MASFNREAAMCEKQRSLANHCRLCGIQVIEYERALGPSMVPLK